MATRRKMTNLSGENTILQGKLRLNYPTINVINRLKYVVHLVSMSLTVPERHL